MAERIVSPGVFTREKDLSFLPQGISEIGAALIGPTQKGPAFTPTIISSFSEFEEIFGTLDSRFYVPYTAKQYLKSAGTVTIVRVLGIGGYQANNINIKVSDYHQSAISSGSDAMAAAYIELEKDGQTEWGEGINANSTKASFEAIIVGLSKIL